MLIVEDLHLKVLNDRLILKDLLIGEHPESKRCVYQRCPFHVIDSVSIQSVIIKRWLSEIPGNNDLLNNVTKNQANDVEDIDHGHAKTVHSAHEHKKH